MPAAYLYDNDTLFKNASKHSAIGMALTIPLILSSPKIQVSARVKAEAEYKGL